MEQGVNRGEIDSRRSGRTSKSEENKMYNKKRKQKNAKLSKNEKNGRQNTRRNVLK